MTDTRAEQGSMDAFLDALASGAPTPGGGGAAALMAAVGAALVAMVCNLTVGRPRYADVEERMTMALREAQELRGQAQALIDADAAAYGEVAAVFALPKGTPDEQAARKTRLQRALKDAAQPPLRVAECAVAALRLCADVADGGNPSVLSDIAVAALAGRAALDAAAVNVRINLKTIRDPAFVEGAEARVTALLEQGQALQATALDRCARAIGITL